MGHCPLPCAGRCCRLYSLSIQMAEKQSQRFIQKMRKTLYVFGNEYLEQDNFAYAVAHYITRCTITHCRSPDFLLESQEKDIFILDVVKGIARPMIIRSADQLKT